MKLVVRVLALSVVVAGAAAASLSSSSTTHSLASRQAATAGLPIPGCGPNVPGCPQKSDPNR